MKYILIVIVFIFVGCSTNKIESGVNKDTINRIMDDWHHSASVADEDVFFGTMNDDCIYIGTDAGERWTKTEMKEWSKPFFDRDTAWAFTPISRNIEFQKGNEDIIWFDELLLTWMDTCRASGVMVKVDGKWKLQHYHLSMAIPNRMVKDYLNLLKEENKK